MWRADEIDKYKLARKAELAELAGKHMGEYGRAWVGCGSRRGSRGS
jgi:hypothetical protein